MVLNGEIVGDVYGTSRVELAPKARIKGNVYYSLLEMSIGAEVNGGLLHRPLNTSPQRVLEDKSAGRKGKKSTESTVTEVKEK